METDDDNQDSTSEDDLDNPQHIAQPEMDGTAQAPSQYDETMDTTQDEPSVEAHRNGNVFSKFSLHAIEARGYG